MSEIVEAPKSAEFLTAEKILRAINKKFPKHIMFVREIKTPQYSFYELALRPERGSHMDDVTTAYSADFFATITPENIKDRGQRILRDFKILMGIPLE